MDFRVLGPLEILDGERRLQLGGAKRRAVAALLLLDANQVVSTDRLVDGVWGDGPPASATGSLHNHVLRLRRELGDRLVTRAPGYLLRVEPGELDLDRFRRRVDDARSAEPERAAALLREALALWRGAPLADLAGEPAAAAAAHLEELRLDALERRIDADLVLGRHRDLVAELEALAGEQPFREHLRAQLLLALYRSGRQADALEAYTAARAALVEELGTEPGAELQELHRAILRQDPALVRPPGPAGDARREDIEEARKTVTVLLADLPVGPGGDPEARRDELRRRRDGTAAVVEDAGGTVGLTADERLLGIFGAPVAHDDDALRAVHAACALRDRGLALRVAVATGDVITGDPGQGRPLVSGQPLDEADRLRAGAAEGDVLVDDRAWRLVRHAVDAAPASRGHRVAAVRHDVEGVVRSFDSPFVGRDAELAEIAAALTRVERDGRARLLTVFGSPGIGKTRLAREAVAAASDGATCLVGRTLPHGIGVTYAPLRDALADLATWSIASWVEELLEGDADAELVVGRVASAVGEGPSAGPAEETAWAARRTLERLAGERPVLLVLEDLHWAAPAFLDLVEHVVEFARAPVLVLALARPDLLDVRPSWGGGGLAASSILLDSLAPEQAADLVDGLAGDATLEAGRRDAILRAGGGNPLFLEHLLAAAREGDEATVPDTIHALLAARLDRLGEGDRRVAQAAALFGQSFPADLVVALLEEDVRPALVRLSRRDFVEPEVPRLVGEERWAFRHALVRDEAYASIPKRRRAALHERVAELVDRRAGEAGLDADELVGHHLAAAYGARAAVEPDDRGLASLAHEAFARLAAAGKRARLEGDPASAAGILSRASDLLPPDAPDRVALAPYLAETLSWTGKRAEAVRTLDDAERHVLPGDDVTRARISVIRHSVHLWGLEAEDPELVYRDAHRAIEILSAADDHEGAAWANVLAVQAAYRRPVWTGETQLADSEHIRNAAAHARAAGSRSLEGLAMGWLCVLIRRGSWPAEDVEAIVAEVLADPPTQLAKAGALGALGTLRAMQGSFEEGRALVAENHQIIVDLGLPQTETADLIAIADVEIMAGEDEEAERVLREALDGLDRLGDRYSEANAAWRLASVLLRNGRVDEAEALLARPAGHQAGEYVHAWRSVLGATIAARRGDAPAAGELVAEADRVLAGWFEGGEYADALVQTARAMALVGEVDDAADRLRRAVEMARRVGYVVTEREAEAELAALGAHAGR